MTELDEELPELVLEIIEEFGKNVPFKQFGASVYDAATRTNVPGVGELTIKAVVEDMRGDSFNGNAVLSGDKKLTCGALAFVTKPQPSDKFDVDGQWFTIAENGVKTTYSGELACLYEIQGRR